MTSTNNKNVVDRSNKSNYESLFYHSNAIYRFFHVVRVFLKNYFHNENKKTKFFLILFKFFLLINQINGEVQTVNQSNEKQVTSVSNMNKIIAHQQQQQQTSTLSSVNLALILSKKQSSTVHISNRNSSTQTEPSALLLTLNATWNATNSSMPVIEWEHPLLGLVLITMTLITIFGNGLVILAVVRERFLKSATNYYIASLACADLLVGLVVMPFNSLNKMTHDFWFFGDIWCDIWHSLDVFASTASINSLLFIALDRHSAISNPINYHAGWITRYWMVFIALIWICSACISFPAIAYWRWVTVEYKPYQCIFPDDIFYLIFSSLVSFYIPLTIMVIVYIRIYRAATQQMNALKCGQKHNVKAGDGSSPVTLRIHRGGYHKLEYNYQQTTSAAVVLPNTPSMVTSPQMRSATKSREKYKNVNHNGSMASNASSSNNHPESSNSLNKANKSISNTSSDVNNRIASNQTPIKTSISPYVRNSITISINQSTLLTKSQFKRNNSTSCLPTTRNKIDAESMSLLKHKAKRSNSCSSLIDHLSIQIKPVGAQNELERENKHFANELLVNSITNSTKLNDSKLRLGKQVVMNKASNQDVNSKSSLQKHTQLDSKLNDSSFSSLSSFFFDNHQKLKTINLLYYPSLISTHNKSNIKGKQQSRQELDDKRLSMSNMVNPNLLAKSGILPSKRSNERFSSSSQTSYELKLKEITKSKPNLSEKAESTKESRNDEEKVNLLPSNTLPNHSNENGHVRSFEFYEQHYLEHKKHSSDQHQHDPKTKWLFLSKLFNKRKNTNSNKKLTKSTKSSWANKVKNLSITKKLAKFSREQKAAKTLGIVMGVFIICWLPFFIYNVITGIFKASLSTSHDFIYSIVTWFGYINSGCNPIIYAFSSRDFRRAFLKILCPARVLRKKKRVFNHNLALNSNYNLSHATSTGKSQDKKQSNYKSLDKIPLLNRFTSLRSTSTHCSRMSDVDCKLCHMYEKLKRDQVQRAHTMPHLATTPSTNESNPKRVQVANEDKLDEISRIDYVNEKLSDDTQSLSVWTRNLQTQLENYNQLTKSPSLKSFLMMQQQQQQQQQQQLANKSTLSNLTISLRRRMQTVLYNRSSTNTQNSNNSSMANSVHVNNNSPGSSFVLRNPMQSSLKTNTTMSSANKLGLFNRPTNHKRSVSNSSLNKLDTKSRALPIGIKFKFKQINQIQQQQQQQEEVSQHKQIVFQLNELRLAQYTNANTHLLNGEQIDRFQESVADDDEDYVNKIKFNVLKRMNTVD